MVNLYVSILLVGIAVIVSKVTIAAGQTIIMEVCVWVSIFLYSAYSESCLKRSLKIDKAKIFMTNGSLMKGESIGAICNTFDLP